VRPSRLAWILLLTAGLGGSAPAAAQSSIFGVRGLGLPGRPISPRARAMGGGFALFDGESGINPAAIGLNRVVTAGFVIAPARRTWESPTGDASLRETRFPHAYVSGPVPGSRISLEIGFGSYVGRDFGLATVDTVQIRGSQVEAFDTLKSLGGMGEIRLGGAYRLSERTYIGAAAHILTGSARLEAHRSFSDSTFLPLAQRAEQSYDGFGLSLGVLSRVSRKLWVAGVVRSDGNTTVEQGSNNLYSVDLPYTFGLGLMYQPSGRVVFAGQGVYRTWSGANSDYQAQGAPGSRNTLELSFGGEWGRNRKRPLSLPIRAGLRYAQLPFPVEAGGKPNEFGISLGTGTRFAQERAAVDLSLERLWRSEGSRYKERVLQLTVGLSIRPYGSR
jgi:hypothetical protein